MIEKHGSQKKVRRSREEIAAFLAAFRESGLTQVAFAREQNLSIKTFRKWLARYRPHDRKDDVPLNGFCAVTLRGDGGNGPVLIRLPGGIEIEVSSQVDPRWMVELVKGLQS